MAELAGYQGREAVVETILSALAEPTTGAFAHLGDITRTDLLEVAYVIERELRGRGMLARERGGQ